MSELSLKMKCFKCPKDFTDLEVFFSHVKHFHGICGTSEHVCSICFNTFTNSSRFKRHVKNCFAQRNVRVSDGQIDVAHEEEVYDVLIGQDNDVNIISFKEVLATAALILVLKMGAKMNFPRSEVFSTVSDIAAFVGTIVKAMIEIITPCVPDIHKPTLNAFISVVETAFSHINTEYKLKKVLRLMGLTEEFANCDVTPDADDIDIDDFVASSDNESDESDVDNDAQEQDDESGDTDEDVNDEVDVIPHPHVQKPLTTILMPLAFNLKSFLELPDVFQKITKNTEDILNENKLNHFITGKLWKEKLKAYKDDDIVIPYHFYVDGAQLNNPLGSHTEKGLENFNYIMLPTIPTKFQSRLENIIVASLFHETHVKDIGFGKIFSYVIEGLTELAEQGIVLNINGREIRVFFVCGLFLGDNKEANRCLGFVSSFVANYYCRFCQLKRKRMQVEETEVPEKRRKINNYNEDVLKRNYSKTGVKEWSSFNNLPGFHVVTSCGNDWMHVVLLGILHYQLKPAIKRFIERGVFTLQELNRRIQQHTYEPHCGNKPAQITEDNLKKSKKFKMTASETYNFAHNLPFLIGDLVSQLGDEDYEVWKFVLITIKFMDISSLHSFEPNDLLELRNTIQIMLHDYKKLFNNLLKPVQHFATHFPSNIEDFGPLRYFQSMRLEAKHQEMKTYSKNNCSRVNVSYSLAKKIQYKTAFRLISKNGLNDDLKIFNETLGSIKQKSYFENLAPCTHINSLMESTCYFADKAVINGITFAKQLWLPDITDNDKKIHKIGDIVFPKQDDATLIFLVCKTYNKIDFNDHTGGYSIDLSSLQPLLTTINLNEYFLLHQHPVLVYNVENLHVFRCKRF